jgi:hypothetical protein
MAQSAQGHWLPPGPAQRETSLRGAEVQMMASVTARKQEIAIGIALQTHVLKICPVHHQLYCDEDACADDENIARAFAVAVELVHDHPPFAEEFHHDAHELTDLLSDTIGEAPIVCPGCGSPRAS